MAERHSFDKTAWAGPCRPGYHSANPVRGLTGTGRHTVPCWWSAVHHGRLGVYITRWARETIGGQSPCNILSSRWI